MMSSMIMTLKILLGDLDYQYLKLTGVMKEFQNIFTFRIDFFDVTKFLGSIPYKVYIDDVMLVLGRSDYQNCYFSF